MGLILTRYILIYKAVFESTWVFVTAGAVNGYGNSWGLRIQGCPRVIWTGGDRRMVVSIGVVGRLGAEIM